MNLRRRGHGIYKYIFETEYLRIRKFEIEDVKCLYENHLEEVKNLHKAETSTVKNNKKHADAELLQVLSAFLRIMVVPLSSFWYYNTCWSDMTGGNTGTNTGRIPCYGRYGHFCEGACSDYHISLYDCEKRGKDPGQVSGQCGRSL